MVVFFRGIDTHIGATVDANSVVEYENSNVSCTFLITVLPEKLVSCYQHILHFSFQLLEV